MRDYSVSRIYTELFTKDNSSKHQHKDAADYSSRQVSGSSYLLDTQENTSLTCSSFHSLLSLSGYRQGGLGDTQTDTRKSKLTHTIQYLYWRE